MPEIRKILVLCTGNSARSQMAAGFLRNLDPRLEVRSAGTKPADRVNPFAVAAMKEIGIDISGEVPTHVDRYRNEAWDFVITVCGNADQDCPVFPGRVGKRLHIGFRDPAAAEGSDAQILAVFREVRDEIRDRFRKFYEGEIHERVK